MSFAYALAFPWYKKEYSNSNVQVKPKVGFLCSSLKNQKEVVRSTLPFCANLSSFFCLFLRSVLLCKTHLRLTADPPMVWLITFQRGAVFCMCISTRRSWLLPSFITGSNLLFSGMSFSFLQVRFVFHLICAFKN